MLDTLRTLLSSAAEPVDLSRRVALTTLPVGIIGAGFSIGASAQELAVSSFDANDILPSDDGFITFANKEEKFKTLFRLERDLRDEGTTISTYQFITYAIVHNQRPQPVLRWEGMEFSYFRRVGHLTWRIHAHNLSYPRDLETGEFISQVRNPFTGVIIDVAPMRLLNDPGVLHGPKGYLPLDAKTVNWLDTYHVLRTEGALVKSEHIRPTPDGWPTLFIESSCSTVSRRDFSDPTITALPFQTSGFYVFPFPEWMKMGDQQGHMIGAWSGRRAVNGIDDLPKSFRDRAAQEDPELLKARWGELDHPLSEVLQEAITT